MPLTPTETKLLDVLKAKQMLGPDEAALRDVLEEKRREAGVFFSQPDDGRLPKVKAFADKVASGAVQEFVLLGVGPNSLEVSLSHHSPPTPSYAMTELVKQIAIFYENRLQEILKAKFT